MTDVVTALTWKYGHVFDTVADQIVGWRHPTDPQPSQAEIDQVVIDYALDPIIIEQNQDNQTARAISGRLSGREQFALTTLMEAMKEMYQEIRVLDPGWDLSPETKRKAQKLIDALS